MKLSLLNFKILLALTLVLAFLASCTKADASKTSTKDPLVINQDFSTDSNKVISEIPATGLDFTIIDENDKPAEIATATLTFTPPTDPPITIDSTNLQISDNTITLDKEFLLDQIAELTEKNGDYIFTLTVTDHDNNKATSTFIITIETQEVTSFDDACTINSRASSLPQNNFCANLETLYGSAKFTALHVTMDGNGDGGTWEDAIAGTNLKTTLDELADGSNADGNLEDASEAKPYVILVAGGAYTPTTNSTDRSASFSMKNYVAITGGWEAGSYNQDPATSPTIFSGDIDANDIPTDDGSLSGNDANSFHVFNNTGAMPMAFLYGATLSGGNANASDPDNNGGGMFNTNDASPQLVNVIFSNNTAMNKGGGMNNSSSSPTLNSVTFSSNTATDSGGGMYNSRSAPTLSGVIFSNNTARDDGGGMYNSDSSSPTLTGLTFSANTARNNGGGMVNFTSSPTLNEVTFSSNTANNGGGMINFTSSPTLTGLTFSANEATNNGGGMFNARTSAPTLSGVTFSANTANNGGGMFNNFSSPTLTGLTFSANIATNNGGGMFNNDSSSPVVANTIFWGNTATSDGDQIHQDRGTLTLAHSILQGGTAAITRANGGSTISYELITNNPNLESLADNGGAILADNGGAVQTIALAATSPAIDAGLYIRRDSSSGISTVFYYGLNNTSWFTEITDAGLSDPAILPADTIALTATDARGMPRLGIPDIGAFEQGSLPGNIAPVIIATSGASVQSVTNLTHIPDAIFTLTDDLSSLVAGSLSVSLAITSPSGYTRSAFINTDYTVAGETLTLKKDFITNFINSEALNGAYTILLRASDSRLTAQHTWAITVTVTFSPPPSYADLCAATGTKEFCDTLTQLYGNAAFTLLHVTEAGTGNERGRTWDNAIAGTNLKTTLDDITDASASAATPYVILVAGGSYTPGPTGRTTSFSMKNYVAITGGWEADTYNRGLANSPTIFSGDIDNNDTNAADGSLSSNNANSFHVFNNDRAMPKALLYGATISGGNANHTSTPDDSGAGMYNNTNANPQLVNVIFSNNTAIYGGGMFNASSLPTLNEVTFSANTAMSGGGMYNSSSSPVLTGVTFSANTAMSGGGMYNFSASSPTLNSVTFSANTATGSGGGMYNTNSSPTLTGLTFSNNTARANGGGMFNNDSSSPTLNEVTFSANTASSNGGGMFNNRSSSPTLTGLTFSANTASSNGGGMFNNSSSPTLNSVTFSANIATNDGGGMYNEFSSSPTLTSVTFSANIATNDGGGMFNTAFSSPTVANTIFWGNTATSSSSGNQIYQDRGTLTLAHSILPSDTADIFTINRGSTNSYRVLNADPLFALALAAGLADNGGAVQTIALRMGSPAINAGLYVRRSGTGITGSPYRFFYSTNSEVNVNWFTEITAAGLITPDALPTGTIELTAKDARGYIRQDQPDIGAYELSGTVPPTP